MENPKSKSKTSGPADKASKQPKAAGKCRPSRKTKKDELKRLLGAKVGTTVAVLSQKLGWQPHTTRAALTRLKQGGVVVERLAADHGAATRYRIASVAKASSAQ